MKSTLRLLNPGWEVKFFLNELAALAESYEDPGKRRGK
jgi:hypothetical protein